MKRVRRLRELWGWLPAFRAAAETQHLPTAAGLLHVSTSSISRAVRLLEQQLGEDLFERSGRAIRLNRSGERLLGSVRDAMRIVDESVEDIVAKSHADPVGIAAPRHLISAVVLTALDTLEPRLSARVSATNGDELDALTRGEIDVAVVEQIQAHPDVTIERVGALAHGVYVANSETPAQGFVAAVGDHWPIDELRAITMHVSDPEIAARVCAQSELAACLPDILASGLHKLAQPAIPATPLYLAYRRPVAQHPRTTTVVSVLRQRTSQLTLV